MATRILTEGMLPIAAKAVNRRTTLPSISGVLE